MIERFVELAQKHAPELRAQIDKDTLIILDRGFAAGWPGYEPELGPVWSSTFTITLLEYLKGLANKWEEYSENSTAPEFTVSEYRKTHTAHMALRKSWDTLTPEAVMQACIDVWEAME